MAYEAVKLKSQTVASSLVLPVLVSVRGDRSLSVWNFLKGNWKVSGDTTDIFLFLDSQIATIHAVHPRFLWFFIVVLCESSCEVRVPAQLEVPDQLCYTPAFL